MISQLERGEPKRLVAPLSTKRYTIDPGQGMEDMMEIRDLILLNVRAIVDEPEKVSIETMPSVEATTFRVQVAPHDLGKAIGKQGRLANALRALIKAAATKNGYRVYLEVV